MIRKIKHHSKRIAKGIINRIKGFTLIELLVVIAVLGILSAAVLVAINPQKRMTQARDAQRKNDISAIANALMGYYTLTGYYPGREWICDTSRGADNDNDRDCSNGILIGGTSWTSTGWTSAIFNGLVTQQQFLKQLPVDPINNSTYYYTYEPNGDTIDCNGVARICTKYWIGTRLESTDDPAKQGKIVFRCTDYSNLPADATGTVQGVGCKEVEYFNATGINSFDDTEYTLY